LSSQLRALEKDPKDGRSTRTWRDVGPAKLFRKTLPMGREYRKVEDASLMLPGISRYDDGS
jgi:hypothetical protein